MWLPNIIFLGLTAAAIIRVANEKSLLPNTLREKVIVLVQRIEQRKKDKTTRD